MGRSLMIVLLLSSAACEIGGAAELPPPELGSRRLVAEVDGPLSVTFQTSGYVQTIRATIPITGDAAAGVQGFVDSHGELFGFEAGGYTTTVSRTRAVMDAEVVRLSTSYDGVPIAGGNIVALVSAGAITYLASYVPRPTDVVTTPTRTEAEVRATLDRYFEMSAAVGAPELVLVDVAALVGADTQGMELAWRLDVEAPVAAEAFVADDDGKLLVLSPKRQTSRGRRVYDGTGQTSLLGAYSGTELANEDDGVAPGAPPDATAVFESLANVRDYYARRLDWEGFDGECRESLLAAVNYPPDIDEMTMQPIPNGFWDARASGFGFTAGMVTADIVAHEFTHAVIDYAASPNSPKYQFIPGAIEEALCDSFAAFATPGASQWVVGEGSSSGVAIEGLPPGAFRSMSDPSIVSDPAHLDELSITTRGSCNPDMDTCPDLYTCLDARCVCTGGPNCDEGGVHDNSGIANHIIYLASVGGRHATVTSRELDGIGVGKMEQILLMSTHLLNDNTRFESWRADVIAACQILASVDVSFPSSGPIEWRDCGNVINAFAAAGVGVQDRDGDSWADDVDTCPSDYNPAQDEDEAEDCITDPWLHCSGLRYELAYEDFLAGRDIGFEREDGDALIMTAQCAFKNRDYYTSETIAIAAAGQSSSGGAATAWYIAEYAAERRGSSSAEGYRENGEAASINSGMCAGLSEEEASGCAGYQRAGLRASLENLQRRD